MGNVLPSSLPHQLFPSDISLGIDFPSDISLGIDFPSDMSLAKGSEFATIHKEKNDVELKCNELQGMVLHRDGNIKLFLRELDRVLNEKGEFQKQVLALECKVIQARKASMWRMWRPLRLLPHVNVVLLSCQIEVKAEFAVIHCWLEIADPVGSASAHLVKESIATIKNLTRPGASKNGPTTLIPHCAGKDWRWLFSSWKAASALVFHQKSFLFRHPFSVLKKGKDLSVDFARKRLSAASLPLSA
ncbi:hypothetical protein Tco_1086945 [Tanacetum coccineum]